MSRYEQGTRHIYVDHLGTPRQIKDAFGATVEGHHYYPFGEELSISQTGETMRFTGHERDYNNTSGTSDDLDYMHARHCSPHTGRFLSVDPKRRLSALKDPLRWNRYAYVSGNPLKLIDPDGREQITFQITTFISAPKVSLVPGVPLGPLYAGGVKTIQRFTIETDPTKSANPVLRGQQRDTGLSQRVDRAGNPIGPPAKASEKGIVAYGARDIAGNATVVATARAGNPLQPGAPPISYDFTIKPNQVGTSFGFTGTYGGFPSARVTATNEAGQTIAVYTFDENEAVAGPLSLYEGIGDQSVSFGCNFSVGSNSSGARSTACSPSRQ